MASTKGYLDYVLEQLSQVPGVTHRAMMGEYLLYVGGSLPAAAGTGVRTKERIATSLRSSQSSCVSTSR